MITVANYLEKKDTIDWSKVPANIKQVRADVEQDFDLYDDAVDVRKLIDLYIEGINKSQKPQSNIIIAKVPKYDWEAIEKDRTDQDKKGILEDVIVKGKIKPEDIKITIGGKNIPVPEKPKTPAKEKQSKPKFKVGDIVYYKQVGMIDKIKSKKLASGFDDDDDGAVKWFYELPKYGDIMAAEEMLQLATLEQINSLKTAKPKEPLVIYNEGKYITKKTLQSAYSFTESESLAYTWKESERSTAEQIAKGHDGLVITMSEAKKLTALMLASKANREKNYPAKTKAPAKTKIAKVIDKTIVDNFSPEFLLIRRFWNIIKTETVQVPFRTVQLLYMAFNKAAVERKVRKVSEAAELFTACNIKIRTLFEDIPNDDKKPYEIEFTDKKLYNEIKEYVSDVAVNPAIPLLKRFIAMQNTKPDIKKAETLLKSIVKVLQVNKYNRLNDELTRTRLELENYIKKPSEEIEPTVYGLSVPKVCKNRVKCSGLTPNGRLKKGYRFEEDSNNVIRVVKGLGSPNVCHNRVKCAGLTAKGQLKKGYKFREDTNEVIRVTKIPATRKPTAKKPVAKKKKVVGLGFSDDIEKVYFNETIIPILPQQNFEQINEVEAPAPKAEPAPIQPPVVKNKLMNMQFDSLEMDEGWENFMQNPAKNLKMAIWGAPKNGKTAGSLQLANYLSKFGKVLYNFADQGFNKSTQDLWQMSGLANNSKAEPNDAQTLAELEKEIATGKYTFVFIDMISDYINKEGIKPHEFKERFMKKYPKVSFILIFEVTKGGNFKGDQGWTHIVDAIVTVEDFLMENRGRYGVGSHIVWEDGLRKFNPKRYEEVMDELQPVDLAFNQVEKI